MTPWFIFGIYSSASAWKSLSSFLSFGGLLLAAVIILSLFYERPFCRYLCPLGAVFSAVCRIRIFRMKTDESSCIGCGACSRNCPMGIDVKNETEE